MTFKVVEVGDGVGTILWPIPKQILDVVGWKDGDTISVVIPGLVKPDYLVVEKKDD